jgi:hypothetical protein
MKKKKQNSTLNIKPKDHLKKKKKKLKDHRHKKCMMERKNNIIQPS